jgi:large subunit ribosomal protein L30
MSESPTRSAAPAAGRRSTRRPAAHRAGKTHKEETLRLKLAKSGIATPKNQKATIRALGFRRVGEVVERPDTPEVRGRIRKIRHLVEIIGA